MKLVDVTVLSTFNEKSNSGRAQSLSSRAYHVLHVAYLISVPCALSPLLGYQHQYQHQQHQHQIQSQE